MTRPLIIAHRGASASAKENTLEAILLAVEQGADMVEMDIRSTKDQVLVINHNDRLQSFRPTIKIKHHTYAQLVDKGFTLPKLADVLDRLPERTLLNLDLKQPTMDLALQKIISDKNREHRVYFDSHNPLVLGRYEVFFPKAKYVLNSSLAVDPFNLSSTVLGSLVAFTFPLTVMFFSRVFKRRIKNFLPTHVSLVPRMCTRSNVDFFHSLGIGVFVCPVNKPENMRKFIALGVEGIKTSRPDVLRQILEY